jgi:hypothetical protein
MSSRCPNVLVKIAEARRLFAAGACWCDCVEQDIPSAEEKVEAGQCGAANSIISAALRRCDPQGRKQAQGTPAVKPMTITPIAPISILGAKP